MLRFVASSNEPSRKSDRQLGIDQKAHQATRNTG